MECRNRQNREACHNLQIWPQAGVSMTVHAMVPALKRPKKARGVYLSPLLAGTRLLHLALERVFSTGKDYRVKWAIQISYEGPDGEWVQTASYMSGEDGEMV